MAAAATISHDDLGRDYNVLLLPIKSPTSISKRVTAVLNHITDKSTDSKQPICCLQARAKVASKLISIVEIAKRQLATDQTALFQYNALSSEMVTLSKRRDPSEKIEGGQDDESGNEEEAFQSMEEKDKIRATPVMTVYLSTIPIKELKRAYGYVDL